MDPLDEVALRALLDEARARRFLGPMPIPAQIAHAGGFVELIDRESCESIVDLGSGGGVPALVIALNLPLTRMTLVERGARRVAFLAEAVVALGLDRRVQVRHGEAQHLARQPDLTASADVVTARSFGPPAVTAECGCRFLRFGGRLIVSEPPPVESSTASSPTASRWPPAGLSPTGLVPADRDVLAAGTFQTLRLGGPIEDRIPRRVARGLY